MDLLDGGLTSFVWLNQANWGAVDAEKCRLQLELDKDLLKD
jgi:hypothetical protein